MSEAYNHDDYLALRVTPQEVKAASRCLSMSELDEMREIRLRMEAARQQREAKKGGQQ